MAVPSTEARVWFEPPTEADRFLPEGPRTMRVEGRPAVVWVNIQTAAESRSGAIHCRFLDDGQHRVFSCPGRPGMIFPTSQANQLLVGMGKEIGLFDLTSGAWEPLARIPDDHERTIINDGEIVPGGGAVVFGTKDIHFSDPIAHLYLFSPARSTVTPLVGGQICSNGKTFGPGCGVTLYDIDTPKKVVTRYRLDVDEGRLIADGVAIDLTRTPGFPDGMCDAGDGTVIVAFYNPDSIPAGRAGRYRLDTGELVDEWTTPGSPRVTCPLLLEVDGSVKLLLTTAVEGMPGDQRAASPTAGSLFLANTAMSQLPVTEFVHI